MQSRAGVDEIELSITETVQIRGIYGESVNTIRNTAPYSRRRS